MLSMKIITYKILFNIIIACLIIFAVFAYPQKFTFQHPADCNFNICLKNTLSEKAIYAIDWIDHPHDWPFPFSFAGGELAPGRLHCLSGLTQCGRFCIRWTFDTLDPVVYEFEQNQPGKLVLLRPVSDLKAIGG